MRAIMAAFALWVLGGSYGCHDADTRSPSPLGPDAALNVGADDAGPDGLGGGDSGADDVCPLPIQPGPCDAFFLVYWFDADLGACLPGNYGGCEGNDNRFATAEACAAACPSVPNDCESPRVWTEVCVRAHPLAGCGEAVMACGKPCETRDDCEGEFSSQCWNNLCQAWSPF